MGILEDVLLPQNPKPENKFRWGAVTSISPLRVQLDGETAPLDITPELCCDVWDGARVWCQINNRQLIVLATSRSTLLSVTKEIRRVDHQQRTTNTATSASAQNVLTVTLPQSLTFNGFVFRISAFTSVANDTAGPYTDVLLKIGAGAATGGNQIAGTRVDQRIASRDIGGTLPAFEYTYGTNGETENTDIMNIVLVIGPSAGNSQAVASASRPSWLSVDWVMP